MQSNAGRPPVIIMGMHRSGTSLIARVLDECGLFLGKDLEANYESIFFLTINEWLLRQSGGAWDNPEPFDIILKNPELRQLIVDHLKYKIASLKVIHYTGIKKYLQGKNPLNMDIHWGWKDPRNIFTMPIWLDIFPEAKIINIYRHGIDVAQSLFLRENKNLTKLKKSYLLKKCLRLYAFIEKSRGFVSSPLCLNLDGCFHLWERYMERSLKMTDSISNEILTIKFEDFVKDPKVKLSEILSFCQVEADNEKVLKALNCIRADRSYAFKNSPGLIAFSQKVQRSKILKETGYYAEIL